MIRFVATFHLAVDDFERVDAFGDELMASLTVSSEVLEPDIAVSMTEGTLEILLVVDTDDGFEAVDRGNQAVRTAFAAAGHPQVETQILMHEELFTAGSAVRTELLSA
jgi:hypothetical protein